MAAATVTPSNNRLYVSNLPFSLEDEAFEKLFEAHGTVQEARIVRNQRNKRSRGYGFVLFTQDTEAAAARDALDGTDVEGRPIAIEIARSEGPREPKPRAPAAATPDAKQPVVDETPGCRIWISNLDWNTDDATLNNMVVAYGTVEECRIVRDRRSNRSRGYAFVKFSNPSEANAAMESMNGVTIGERDVKVEIAHSKGPHPSTGAPPRRGRHPRRRPRRPTGEAGAPAARKPDSNVGRRVYISHLAPSATEELLDSTFGPFGEIESREVVQDTRNPDEVKAYGFVTFVSSEAADSAVANLNDTQIGEATCGVELARARGGRRRRRFHRRPREGADAAEPAE
jgi:nucleolin